MINRVLVLLIAGCALLASVIVLELWSDDTGASAKPPVVTRPEAGAPPRARGPRVDDLLGTILDRPLLSPTRQAGGRASPDQPTGQDLSSVRLTGIVIEPGRHLAIFAAPDAKPMVRSEGEMLSDWRLDSITLGEVVLSGPAGSRTLQPKSDASLARRVAAPPRPAPRPPQVAPSGQQPAAVAARSATAPPAVASPKQPPPRGKQE